MRNVFFLVFGLLVSCAPVQTVESDGLDVGRHWRLTVENQVFDIRIQNKVKISEDYTFMGADSGEKAGALVTTPPIPYKGLVAFIAKSRLASSPIKVEELRNQEGITCVVPFEQTAQKLEGNYTNGLFRISSIDVTNDGRCFLERI